MTPAAAAAAAFATGFGCMAAELTAVRLLAPHFGDSAYVWTNVIGVILAAMALGAAIGGRLSRSPAVSSWPARLLLLGAALLALAPAWAGAVGSWLMPPDLPLDAAMPAMVRGSLVASALLFAPPLLLLAAVSPLLIALLARDGVAVGRAAGHVAAAGTVGSLIGTFAATHWLVPGLGCRLAMLVAALAVAAASLCLRPSRAGVVACLVAFGLGAGVGLVGPLRSPPPGTALLAERESDLQYLQVLRQATPGEASRTVLAINEGLDSFHSLRVEGSVWTGAYYDWHAVVAWFSSGWNRPEDLRAASIGDAAGSLRAVYAGLLPGATVAAIDIDGATMLLGDLWFDGPRAQGARYVVDGRVFANHASLRYHVVHVDAYAHQVHVPAHLASREFFCAVHERLVDGGIVVCNVGALEVADPVLQAIGATAASAFGNAAVLLVPGSRNAVLLARRGGAPDIESLSQRARLPDALTAADRERGESLLRTVGDASSWHRLEAGREFLVDDRPVLDELLFESYVTRHDVGALVPTTGGTAVAGAEVKVYEAALRGDWRAVLDAVAESREASAFLREQAGDARWRLRELVSAMAEYDEALALAGEPGMRARLEEKRSALAEDLRPVQRAAAIATRNAWLGTAIAAIAAMIGVHLLRRGPALVA